MSRTSKAQLGLERLPMQHAPARVQDVHPPSRPPRSSLPISSTFMAVSIIWFGLILTLCQQSQVLATSSEFTPTATQVVVTVNQENIEYALSNSSAYHASANIYKFKAGEHVDVFAHVLDQYGRPMTCVNGTSSVSWQDALTEERLPSEMLGGETTVSFSHGKAVFRVFPKMKRKLAAKFVASVSMLNSASCDEFCGDGIVQPGEECDDQNFGNLDGCSKNCLVEPFMSCTANNRNISSTGTWSSMFVPDGTPVIGPQREGRSACSCIAGYGSVRLHPRVCSNYISEMILSVKVGSLSGASTISVAGETFSVSGSGGSQLSFSSTSLQSGSLASLSSTAQYRLTNQSHIGLPTGVTGAVNTADALVATCLNVQAFDSSGSTILFSDGGSLDTDPAGKFIGGSLKSPARLDTCGDGKVSICAMEGLSTYCDDGNLVDGDGCSSTCSVEPAMATSTSYSIRMNVPPPENSGGEQYGHSDMPTFPSVKMVIQGDMHGKAVSHVVSSASLTEAGIGVHVEEFSGLNVGNPQRILMTSQGTDAFFDWIEVSTPSTCVRFAGIRTKLSQKPEGVGMHGASTRISVDFTRTTTCPGGLLGRTSSTPAPSCAAIEQADSYANGNYYIKPESSNITSFEPCQFRDSVIDVENSCSTAVGHCLIVGKKRRVVCVGESTYGTQGTFRHRQTHYHPIFMLRDVSKLACGSENVYALTANGKVFMWGRGESTSAHTGVYDAINTVSPFEVPLDQKCVKVVASIQTACCLLASGEIQCWGANTGQIINPASDAIPHAPYKRSDASGVVDIALSSGSMCIVTQPDRKVSCTGIGNNGNLGDNSTITRSTFSPVSILGSVKSIHADDAYRYCVILTSDNTVRCWGNGANSGLGNGGTANSPTPLAPIGLPPVKSIALGEGGSFFAITLDDAFYVHGHNSGTGILGTSHNAIYSTPYKNTNLPHTPVAVFAGKIAMVQLRSGEIRSAGSGSNGERGDGKAISIYSYSFSHVVNPTWNLPFTTERFQTIINYDGQIFVRGGGRHGPGTVNGPLVPGIAFFGFDDFVLVSAYLESTCGIRLNGEVWCWGSNANQHIAPGNLNTYVDYPQLIKDIDPVHKIELGGSHSCVQFAYTHVVKCWGANGSGQLGIGSNSNANTPTSLSSYASERFVDFSLQWLSSCFISRNRATLCVGNNNYGDLGNGDSTNKATQSSLVSTTVPSGASEIACGYHHCCITLQDGAIHCWGRNSQGGVGDGTLVNKWTAVGINFPYSTQLARSSYGMCMLATETSAGAVYCWGQNYHGSVGNGATSDVTSPTAVINLPGPAVSLSASINGTICARILTSSTQKPKLYCWGNNEYQKIPRIGLEGTRIAFPQEVNHLRMSSGQKAMPVIGLPWKNGGDHVCFTLLSRSSILCTGSNSNGQIGNGSPTSKTYDLPVSTSQTAVAVSCGRYSTCAIQDSDNLICWGKNNAYQLGVGNTDDVNKWQTTVTLTSVRSFDIAEDHGCAVTLIGSVYCWGNGASYKTGTGTTSFTPTPTVISSLSSNVKAVACGRDHSCALKNDGTVWCWGSNSYGQIGNNNNTAAQSPAMVLGLSSVSQIYSLSMHTCAVKGTDQSSTAWCWGNNINGQLGDGTKVNRATPVQVLGLVGVKMVATSWYGTSVLTHDGRLYYMGTNGHGLLSAQSSTPVLVTSNVALVAGGLDFFCFLASDSWLVFARGQLGRGFISNSESTPMPVVGLPEAIIATNEWALSLPKRMGKSSCIIVQGSVRCVGLSVSSTELGSYQVPSNSVKNATSITGLEHIGVLSIRQNLSLAVKSTGEALLWHDNSPTFGVFPRAQFQLSGLSVLGGLDADVGESHFCVSRAYFTSTRVHCAGNNDYGQLGIGAQPGTRHINLLSYASGAATAFYNVSLMAHSSCSISNTGVPHCWGRGDLGQLGDGTLSHKSTPTAVVLASSNAPISANTVPMGGLATGAHHACVLSASSGVLCWGLNTQGCTGEPNTAEGNAVSKAIVVPNLMSASSIACGEYHCCVILTSGSVYCWGDGRNGQLGHGQATSSVVPVQAIGIVDAVQLSLGAKHSCALLESGSTVCFGDNTGGKLGDGTETQRSTPVLSNALAP